MQYAKDVEGKLVYPTAAEFVGIPNWTQHDRQLRKRGYVPLMGTPEEREGFNAKPITWNYVQQSIVRTEPRQTEEDIFEEDPETHEQHKTGTRIVMQDKQVEVDTSYLEVTSWEYTAIPEPEPEPAPVVAYSKYKLKLACESRGLWEQVKAAIETAGKWESFLLIQTISSDNQELKDTLPDIRAAFGSDVVDAVLAESIAE